MSPSEHRVAVIGAGVAGLVCAYRLAEAGVDVTVYERWPGLGGQAATLDAGDGVRIERYYHFLFTSDRHMIELYDELGLAETLRRYETSAAIAVGGRIWPFNGALDLLRFSPLPLLSRLRMGLALFRMQLQPAQERYESVTAHEWIVRHMGKPAWEHVWGPLMRGKFGERAEQISMVWIWDKVMKRRNVKGGEARQEAFLYADGGFEPLFAELERRITAAGGRVLIDQPAREISDGRRLAVTPAKPDSFRLGHDPRLFEASGDPEEVDAVVACVPAAVFSGLLAAELRDRARCRVPGPDRRRRALHRAQSRPRARRAADRALLGQRRR